MYNITAGDGHLKLTQVILPYVYNSGTLVTFIDDGDGTYSYTTSKPNIFSCGDSIGAGFGDWVVKNNKLWIINISRGGNKGRS